MIPVVALLYFLFIRLITTAYFPQASAIAILGGVCLFLSYLARRSNSRAAVTSVGKADLIQDLRGYGRSRWSSFPAWVPICWP
jgi:hypothetical protein